MIIERTRPPLFRPRQRLAVLINGYDPQDQYDPLGLSGGNKSVYKMEAALRRGTIDPRQELSRRFEHNRVCQRESPQTAADRIKKNVDRIFLTDCSVIDGHKMIDQAFGRGDISYCARQYLSLLSFINPMQYGGSVSRRPIRYVQIRKFFPDSIDLKSEVYGALAFFSEIADKDTLTLFFIRAHGLPGSASVFQYSELLERLDNIAGKKALVVIACHSGSILKSLRGKPTAENYIVIPSTRAGELGTNWADDNMSNRLINNIIARGQRLSTLGNATTYYSMPGYPSQVSIPRFPFDIIL